VSAAGRTDTWLLAEPLRRHGLSDDEIWSRMPAAFERMQAYVEEHLPDLREQVLPGVPEVLADLDRRGQLLGLLTGNLSRIATAKMRAAGLKRYFDVGGFGEESEIRSPLVPVAIAKAGERAGRVIPAELVVVIGDTPLDIEAGQIAGTRTVGVATGPYSVEALQDAGADLALASLADVRESVEAMMRLVERPARGSGTPLQ
jgi:phosphoglycolate phosphatase-like HAD superfamily hydrolase